ncbi:MAG: hypothetical protein IT562_10755 [Alphaproteobacteria bacterium]|nr:hypothetical protein [Alphaproteobacteria bacterium]
MSVYTEEKLARDQQIKAERFARMRERNAANRAARIERGREFMRKLHEAGGLPVTVRLDMDTVRALRIAAAVRHMPADQFAGALLEYAAKGELFNAILDEPVRGRG